MLGKLVTHIPDQPLKEINRNKTKFSCKSHFAGYHCDFSAYYCLLPKKFVSYSNLLIVYDNVWSFRHDIQ